MCIYDNDTPMMFMMMMMNVLSAQCSACCGCIVCRMKFVALLLLTVLISVLASGNRQEYRRLFCLEIDERVLTTINSERQYFQKYRIEKCWVEKEPSIQLSVLQRKYIVKGKGKGFPYSTPSVGPGADPGVQAVSLQVTVSHPPGGRLPLLSARPAVTSPAAEHHRPLAGTKLYCLVTEAHR